MADQKKTNFTGLTLKSFSRSDKGLTASFSANLTEKIIGSMGWASLRDHETSVGLDGKLAAKQVVLSAAGTLSNIQYHIDAQEICDFEGIRRNLENKKGKGFRHELHFKMKSGDPTGAKALEEFMLSIPPTKGTLVVMHAPPTPKQGTLEGSESDDDQVELTEGGD